MRRGAAAQTDIRAPAPDPGGANIYLATVAKQGGRRREASSWRPWRLLPIPLKRKLGG